MRNRFDEQLKLLKQKMTQMGDLCEKIIDISINGLFLRKSEEFETVPNIGAQIDHMEREIEAICLKLLLQQQPVAGDLRQISAALKMITDMERIGDQAEDIAEIVHFLKGRNGKECTEIKKMAAAAIKMVDDSVEAYVNTDLWMARDVIKQDDFVDDCFLKVKNSLIKIIAENHNDGEYALDLLMIAKYLERIGDHATNIGEWVEFSITGEHKNDAK